MTSPESLQEQRKRQIAARALERRSQQERTAYLDGACGGDQNLRAEVEALLANIGDGQTAGADVPAEGALDAGFVHDPLAANGQIDAPPLERAGTIIGRYKLLEQIGEGGFGSVWMAEQREPVRRRVALKIIKLGMDTRQVVARFEAERQTLALMDHPNIAKVFDAGATETGRPYFVMELVRGMPITRYCDQERMATQNRLELFIQVCNAIQHAHQKGIIHRDIKPSNILVTLHDGTPVPQVIDFGIAKATQQELTEKTIFTQFSQFIGTPAYTSPEQAEMSGLDIDTRSDIYSLGVVLYELLTGSTPFNSRQLIQSGLDEMRRVIREDEPIPPSTKVAALSGDEGPTTAMRRGSDVTRLVSILRGDLDWIVMKCLEKDRSRRYDTANALAADLKRHLENEPVSAMPPSTAYRLRKAWKRNRLAYSAAAGIVAALTIGLGVAVWGFVREKQAQREQSRLRLEAEAARSVASEQRDLARKRLYESLAREARSIRLARQVGFRQEVFDRIQQALALQIPDQDLAVLRREAVACLGDWVGLAPVDIPGVAYPTADALVANGSLLALATARGAVTLRDTQTGREIAALETGGFPASLAFDQRGSQLLIVTYTPEGTAQEQLQSSKLERWSQWQDGSWRRDWQRPAPGVFALENTQITPVALRFDSATSALELLDPAKEMRLARFPTQARIHEMPRAALSQDRRLFAFFSYDGDSEFDAQVEVWDLELSQRIACLTPRFGRGYGLSFGPAGDRLACSFDNMLIVYDTQGFKSTFSLGGSFAETAGCTLGGTAMLAVPSYQEQAVHLLDLFSGSELASLTSPSSLQSVRFSRDGKILVIRHVSGCRILHQNVDQERIPLEGHRGGVPAVEFSPNGTQLASTGKDRTLRLWDLAAPYAGRVLGMLPAAGQSLAYRSDGRLLACADYATGRISLWSPETGRQILEVGAEPPHPGAVWGCALSADGRHLAAAGGGLRVWSLSEKGDGPGASSWNVKPLFSEDAGQSNVSFHPDGEQLAYVDILRAPDVFVTGIYLRDLAPSVEPWLVTSNSQASIIQIQCFLPRSGNLLYVNRDREIVIMDPASRETVRRFPTLGPGAPISTYLGNVCVSPDELKLAMVSPTGLGVDLWDVTTGRHLYSLPDQPGPIWWLAWSPESRRLAVSRANGAIAIWNISAVETQLAKLGLN